MSNKIYLTLSVNYVEGWGFWEAARELIANAKDAGSEEIQSFNDRGDRWVSIKSQGGSIPTESLLLGNSSNRSNEDAIGKFGEGQKLAMLVLTRMDYTLRIKNGFDRWLVTLENHPQLNSQCLCVEIQENFYGVEDTQEDIVEVTILGLTDEDAQELTDKYLPDESFIYNLDEGDLLLNFEGNHIFRYLSDTYPEDRMTLEDNGNPKKVFVNGLFVCDLPDEYVFSYNLKPNRITLDRDRNSVSTWDLQREVAELLEDAGAYELMVQMSEEKVPDLYEYYTPSRYKSAVYGGGSGEREESVSEVLKSLSSDKFKAKHGENSVAVSLSGSQAKRQVIMNRIKLAGKIAVEVPETQYKLLSEELKIVPEITWQQRQTPVQMVQSYLEGNKKHLRSKAKKELEKLIEDLILMS